MKRSWVLAGVCLCILIGDLSSQAGSEMSTEQRERFRAARTVRVISEVSLGETTGIQVIARGAISPAAFTQPFEEVTRAALEPAVSGWPAAGAAPPPTLRFACEPVSKRPSDR
jgi:hypothetical protein